MMARLIGWKLFNALFHRTLESFARCLAIKRIKTDVISGKYSGYIKLDVSDFYPSIKHKELESRLRKRIKDPGIINVIRAALTSPTVTVSKVSDKPSTIGVPQGLAISNILAAIYLLNIDRHLNTYSVIAYSRYVDDVLILCDSKQAEEIAKDVISRFRRIGLIVHDPIKNPDKSSIGDIKDRFDYLGYHFNGEIVSARTSTIEKLKESIAAIFTSHKHSKQKNEKFLEWRLNLRITGCVFEDKSKGWLFFFSEINDESLLHSLDNYVRKLIKRFNVEIKSKRFSRAFKELSYRRYETNYIPNFDNYNLDQKKTCWLNFSILNSVR
jgi:hypothetical protein